VGAAQCINDGALRDGKMVDKLQGDIENCDQPGCGFFTLDEFLGKRHLKFELHLVMVRDEVKGKVMIYAMLLRAC
jgi:hypothetical protein